MKIIFHDVDGCLNAPDGAEIPRNNQHFSAQQSQLLQALGKALDASMIDIMVINTGRSLEDTKALVNAISSNKLKYLIAEHGAVIFDIDNDQALIWQSTRHASNKKDPLEQILAFMQWYKETGGSILTDRLGTSLVIDEKVANLTLKVPPSVDCHHVFEQLQQLVRDDSPFEHEDLVFHNSVADGFVDVMSKIDKGDGIEIICHQLRKPEATIIAVGNGLNDIPMFEKAHICLCPANSEPDVKDYCQKSAGIISEYTFIEATLNWLSGTQKRA
ncbi:HAD hydrolase family protein [Granulosicoccus sp.]|nr:HAD hydrolase family protein [Granulosicoccus sp.]MDB4223058.1 HAD hydrolase family protein [Granulosicoccus sp.]